MPNPMGIAVHMSDVYWVDRNLQTVYKASKLPGNTDPPTAVRTGLSKLRDIVIYDVANQPPDDSNPCRRFGERPSFYTSNLFSCLSKCSSLRHNKYYLLGNIEPFQ